MLYLACIINSLPVTSISIACLRASFVFARRASIVETSSSDGGGGTSELYTRDSARRSPFNLYAVDCTFTWLIISESDDIRFSIKLQVCSVNTCAATCNKRKHYWREMETVGVQTHLWGSQMLIFELYYFFQEKPQIND